MNDVVVHGIPDGRALAEGDIISIDCGAVVDGYHGDAAFTAGVGAIDAESQRLIDVTRAALDAGIAELVPGNRLGDLGAAVQGTVERAGFSVVREYVGHGIGTAMHEAPDVPNYGKRGKGKRVSVGDVLAVEPMVCARGQPHRRARRRLDRGDRRRVPGRPLGAHHRGHRRRPRTSSPCRSPTPARRPPGQGGPLAGACGGPVPEGSGPTDRVVLEQPLGLVDVDHDAGGERPGRVLRSGWARGAWR